MAPATARGLAALWPLCNGSAGEALPILEEAAQESLLAPLGLLLVALSRHPSRVRPPPSSLTVVLAGAIVVLTFWLTLGRGYTAA
ncbi:hypothetical protein K8O61_01830 [Xanthomonas cerealis pv. cerealis]|uniref:hypothetical protein n=1 Tax=Xanthomonas cerealis TaxID=3390025 RepID=UPI001F46038D|nr:hypothetical protein [Xanthomonas translucens]UKE69844.1 hypothetical protein K8O61_01830 [Xanthomonas translucens pv. pistacia]